ncbi:hypothetical protein Ssed_3618 [Shewanella sediminis HAW-EB3]|uniref:Teneurin NHL domain-containing protein n=1 Tax=Shewanella sediminis (strain HAW-EB3) TaxID=425104 RepID=A8FZE9_SHESH|nr:hypothetical protein [Shewanella sediminis]ABV38222.1 hypothetical protein Ssed_3618 [Shewanella sediminis HAW-EB3]
MTTSVTNGSLIGLVLATLLISLPSHAVEEFDYQSFSDSFSIIDTVAGRGKHGEKYHNGWQTGFENHSAKKAELSRPHQAIADSDGNIFIADKDAHAIRKIDLNGMISTYVGTNESGFNGDSLKRTLTQLSFPNGIWLTASEALFILDSGNDMIRRVEHDGTVTTLFKDEEGIETGRGLWVSDDESVVYYSSGSELKQWRRGRGIRVLADGFDELANLAVNAKGELFVTDRDANLVYKVSANGDKEIVAGTGKRSGCGDGCLATDTALNQVRGIWFHPNGGYFLATHKGGQIWFVDPDGVIHLFVDGGKNDQHFGDRRTYNTPGKKISEPRAISMDSKGNLLITESDYGYIRIVKHIDKAEVK